MADASTPAQAVDLLFSCFKRMGRLLDVELGKDGLSLSRSKLLGELGRGGPQQQSALATTFSLAPRTVTELVDTLERDGLVERRSDPRDRRARLVQLTATGEEARIRAQAVKERLITQALGSLNPRQIIALASTLQLIEAQIEVIEADINPVATAVDTPSML